MLKEFEEPVFEFVKRVSRLPNIRSVVLFGSVARGEADKRSDIDVLIVFDAQGDLNKLEEKRQVSEIALDIEKEYDRSLQLVFSNRDLQGLDRQFIQEVLKEGITLFGRAPAIEAEGLRLQPYSLIHYRLSSLSRPDKMRVKRALYGHETKRSYKGKVYTSKVKGLVEKLEGKRTGLASVLLPLTKAKVLTHTLETFGANYEKIDVWLAET